VNVVKTRRIKLNPTRDQRLMLEEWWHAYRYTYNATIDSIIRDTGASPKLEVVIKPNATDDGITLAPLRVVADVDYRLKVDLQAAVKQSKVSAKIRVLRSGGVKLGIKVLQDASCCPVILKLRCDYPEAQQWLKYRDELVSNKNDANPFFSNKAWLLKTNKHIRASAVKDACAAYKGMTTHGLLYGTVSKVRTLYLHKKGDSWSLGVEKDCVRACTVGDVRALSICPKAMRDPICCFGDLPFDVHPECDSKIHRDRYGVFWFMAAFKKAAVNHVRPPRAGVALDLGEKKPFTGYSTDGRIQECGANARGKLLQLLHGISRNQSLLDSGNNGVRNKVLRGRIDRTRAHIRNLVDDMHWRAIKHLTDTHNLVVLGKFFTRRILQSAIAKPIKQVLQQLSPYTFKQRLMLKCQETGVTFVEHSEWGTTKGCPCCGARNELRQYDMFDCHHCSYKAERDAKSACCIMLKYVAGVQ
jgi:hypothetical protein